MKYPHQKKKRMNNDIDVKLGRKNVLRVVKQVDFGFYLDGGEMYEEILLPNGEILPEIDVRIGEMLEVFVYLDNEERLVATTKPTLAQVGDFAYLEVAWVNNFGAVLHWGPMKDLFVPFREQKMKMQKGQKYLAHIHLDPESHRIVASAKIEKFLSPDTPPYQQGDEVDILIWQKTELGLKAIVDNRFGGLLYDNQIFRPLRTGDRTTAFVQNVRPDNKIDLILQAQGQEAARDFSERLHAHLLANTGYTPLGDKSPAEEIYAVFGVSKKVFKKAVGDLYKRKLITIEPDGLHLTPAGAKRQS